MASISRSSPFEPIPSNFNIPDLSMRGHFIYEIHKASSYINKEDQKISKQLQIENNIDKKIYENINNKLWIDRSEDEAYGVISRKISGSNRVYVKPIIGKLKEEAYVEFYDSNAVLIGKGIVKSVYKDGSYVTVEENILSNLMKGCLVAFNGRSDNINSLLGNTDTIITKVGDKINGNVVVSEIKLKPIFLEKPILISITKISSIEFAGSDTVVHTITGEPITGEIIDLEKVRIKTRYSDKLLEIEERNIKKIVFEKGQNKKYLEEYLKEDIETASITHNVTIKYIQKTKPPVDFNHATHERYTNRCSDCHHKGNNNKCIECHKSKAERGVPEFKEIMHQSCKGCHKKDASKKAPVKCDGCHKK
jgi:hypothetical protein